MNIPTPPSLDESANYKEVSADNIVSGSVSFNPSSVGFFQQTPVNQQQGAPTLNNSGSLTTQTDHDMLISIVNTLANYGLMSYSTVYGGRTFTFTNLTTDSPLLELFITVGGPGNTLTSLGTFGQMDSIVYDIPTTIGWTGNFQVWPVGFLPVNQLGATLFEFSANDQVYNALGQKLPLRDNWDISTVPPYLPVPQLDCGPRNQAVAVSYAPITAAGTGYNPGYNLDTSTSGSGTGLKVDLISVVGSGLTYPACAPPYNTPGVGGYTIRNFGTGYVSGDTITVLQPMAISLISGGTGYTGTASGVATTGGAGSGLTVDILEVSGGVITKLGVASTGSGYVAGTAAITVTTGNTNAILNVISTTAASGGVLTKSVLELTQCQSYNVGIQVIPPAPPTGASYPPLQTSPGPYWPPITVIANNLDGNCAQAITYPNDTALPKSQVGYAQGSYTINIVDPTVIEII